MSNDLSHYIIVAGLQLPHALNRAQHFLRLAERASTEEDRRSLAGAAIILSIAYLSQSVEFRLVQALANATFEDGRRPSEPELREQLPGGLKAKMRRLATVSAVHACTLMRNSPRPFG
jgi:hypothetical protein